LRDLSAYPLILTGQETSVRQILERTLEHERLPVQVAQEVTYMTTAIGMVNAGLGIAILPESALALEAGVRLRAVAIREPELTRSIGTLCRKDRSLSPAAQRLVDVLHDVVAPTAGGDGQARRSAAPSAARTRARRRRP
jgi:DNA-binding transcriptional LysR family regulator